MTPSTTMLGLKQTHPIFFRLWSSLVRDRSMEYKGLNQKIRTLVVVTQS